MTFEDLIRALMDRVIARVRLLGFYLYSVVEDGSKVEDGGAHDLAQERVTLRRVGEVAGLPDLVHVDKRHGAHGLYNTSSPGQRVLVGFEAGDPGRPFVAFYVPSNPATVLVDADAYVQIGTTDPERPEKRVYVGSKDRLPVARETDPIAAGVIRFAPDPVTGTTTVITYAPQDGPERPIGVIAAPFTPDLSTGGLIGVQGKVMAGSTFFRSE